MEECKWTLEDDDESLYETGCNSSFILIGNSLKENKMFYCCYCGKKIKEDINND